MFVVVSSRFLGGLGAVLGVFLFRSSYHFLKEGSLETATVAEHTRLDSIRLISKKSQSPKILLRQAGKVGTLFYHNRSEIKASHTTLGTGKTSTFRHFECVPPKPVTHFSHQSRPSQRSRTIAPQAGVGRYRLCRGRFQMRVNKNSICPPLLGVLLFLAVGADQFFAQCLKSRLNCSRMPQKHKK